MRSVLLDYPDRHRYGQGSARRGGDHMSQNPQKPKLKIEPKLESAIVIRQPTVRNFSTGGGQMPGDVIIGGDPKNGPKKRQGYPPVKLYDFFKTGPRAAGVSLSSFFGVTANAPR